MPSAVVDAGTLPPAPHFHLSAVAQVFPLIRFRVRHLDQQIGPWWPTIEQAEQAAINLELARHDEDYDVLVFAPDVEIDGDDSGEADRAGAPAGP
jgi:hypothetical protein